MQKYSVSLYEMISCFWRNRWLLKSLVKRDVARRYKGAVLGLFWSFITPLFMLAVYTFAFSVVFQARWGEMEGSTGRLRLYCFPG